jgi:DNA-binding transcriptional MerR regulator
MSMKALLRRGEVMHELGISKHRLRALIARGLIRPRRLLARGKMVFISSEIEAVRQALASGQWQGASEE